MSKIEDFKQIQMRMNLKYGDQSLYDYDKADLVKLVETTGALMQDVMVNLEALQSKLGRN